VASIPHTGMFVPHEIDQLFISNSMRKLSMTDWYLHHLYDFLPHLGVNVITANYSRYVIDLNRSPTPMELYPGRFETKLVADTDFQGQVIFAEYPSQQQIESYKQNVHQTYHSCLNELIEERLTKFDKVYLFDLHSIAKEATLVHDELKQDIYLGNRDGQSCSNEWLSEIENQFLDHDISVQKNKPYKGGYITHLYGSHSRVEAIQIEMNQSLYLPEIEITCATEAECIQSVEFLECQKKLKSIFKNLIKK